MESTEYPSLPQLSSVSLGELPYPKMSTSSDSELEEVVELVVVLHSLMLRSCRRYWPCINDSNLFWSCCCVFFNCTFVEWFFFSLSSSIRIKLFAFVNSPKVVCLEDSLPTGTMSFNFSKQYLKCARLLGRKKILKSQTRTQNCFLIMLYVMSEVNMQKI